MDTHRRTRHPRQHDASSGHGRLNEEGERDLLDEPVLPLLGLSGATLRGRLCGRRIGTVAGYLLEAHHPTAQGGFPWVT